MKEPEKRKETMRNNNEKTENELLFTIYRRFRPPLSSNLISNSLLRCPIQIARAAHGKSYNLWFPSKLEMFFTIFTIPPEPVRASIR